LILWSFTYFSGNVYAYKIDNLELNVNAGAKETYDDNVTYVKENRKKDSSTTMLLGFDAKYENALRSLNASGNIYHQMFNKYTKYDNTSQDFSLDFKNEFSSRMRLNITDNFLHAYEPRSFEQAFEAVPGRYAYFQNDFGAIFDADINKRLIGKIKYANSTDIFSRADLSDSYLNQGGFGLEYELSELTKLLVDYDFAERDFSPGNSASAHILSGGVKTNLNKRLSIEGDVGVDIINSFNDSDYAKPHFKATVNHDVDEKTMATLSFLKEYSTTAYTEDIFNHWQVYAVLKRQLSRRFDVSLSAFYGEGRYVSSDIHDGLRGANVDLIYNFSEKIKTTLGCAYSQADSSDSSREYTKNLISLGLLVQF